MSMTAILISAAARSTVSGTPSSCVPRYCHSQPAAGLASASATAGSAAAPRAAGRETKRMPWARRSVSPGTRVRTSTACSAGAAARARRRGEQSQARPASCSRRRARCPIRVAHERTGPTRSGAAAVLPTTTRVATAAATPTHALCTTFPVLDLSHPSGGCIGLRPIFASHTTASARPGCSLPRMGPGENATGRSGVRVDVYGSGRGQRRDRDSRPRPAARAAGGGGALRPRARGGAG